MTELTFTYNEGEYAWVTDVLTLYGNINVKAQLKTDGMLIIKELEDDGKMPCALVSELNKDFEVKVRCGMRGVTNGRPYRIKIFTSEEPEYIRYANI